MQLDFLKKAKKSEIMAFAVLVCVIAVVGYYFLFLSPMVSKLTFLFRESARLQNTINMAEISINSMPKMRKEIEGLRSKEGSYSSKLPSEEEFPAILENLATMAKNARVKITKILPAKDSAASHEGGSDIYRQKEILINAQCGYHELGTFIAELENSKRFMEIADIRIEAGKVNPKRHNVQLVVKTFILKGENE